MISYLEALSLIEDRQLNIESETLSIQRALNRLCDEEIRAPFSMPRFNNSAMDGFALKYQQTKDCNVNSPKSFQVIKSIAAGDKVENDFLHNGFLVAEIMTGAQIPSEYNCVIPVEEIKLISNNEEHKYIIEINRELKNSENVRYKGEDVEEGNIIISKNELITHEKIMLLTSFGIDSISVKKRIKVAILSTGKELVDDISGKLNDQQIFNSNTPYLNSILNDFPVETKIFNSVPDNNKLFLNTINEIKNQGFHLIISTGAVSKGKWDIIPECLKELGADIIFHKVKIKPGKPILFAQLNSSIFYFGLPGNPISTAVGFRFFISPFIRSILGLKKESMKTLKLLTSGSKKLGMTFFLKGKILIDDNSTLRGEILSGQESFKMKSLTESNGWIILPENMEKYNENDFAYFSPLEVNSKLFI